MNVPSGGITGEAMLLLRIYTLDVNTGELIVIGNGIIRLFNEDDNDEVCVVYRIYRYTLFSIPNKRKKLTMFPQSYKNRAFI